MMATRLSRSVLLSLAAGSVFVGGCVTVLRHEHYRRPVRRTHVHTTHVHPRTVCTHDCPDCYYDGSRVVVIKGHRHGPGCGHHWDGRNWVVVRKVRPPVGVKVVPPRRTVHKAGPAGPKPHVHKAKPPGPKHGVRKAKLPGPKPHIHKAKPPAGSKGVHKSPSAAGPKKAKRSKGKRKP